MRSGEKRKLSANVTSWLSLEERIYSQREMFVDFLSNMELKLEKAWGHPKDRGNHVWPNRGVVVANTADLRFHSLGFFARSLDSKSWTSEVIQLSLAFSRTSKGRS